MQRSFSSEQGRDQLFGLFYPVFKGSFELFFLLLFYGVISFVYFNLFSYLCLLLRMFCSLDLNGWHPQESRRCMLLLFVCGLSSS